MVHGSGPVGNSLCVEGQQCDGDATGLLQHKVQTSTSEDEEQVDDIDDYDMDADEIEDDTVGPHGRVIEPAWTC